MTFAPPPPDNSRRHCSSLGGTRARVMFAPMAMTSHAGIGKMARNQASAIIAPGTKRYLC